jgi:hypothetical protein
MSDEPVIIAKLEYEGRALIHNDLISAAFNLKERIDANMKKGELSGIGLDIMAAVTMTAFAYEAYLNFVGFTVIEDFVEFQNGKKKRNQIMAALGIEWNDDVRPFATINRLIEVRDIMAHGKPYFVKTEWEAIGTHSELVEQIRSYRVGIEGQIDYDLLRDAYDDVEVVWRMMLKAGGIEAFDTLDGGSSGITFKGYAEPAPG